VNKLKVQRLESRRKTLQIYKVVGCLMLYQQCTLISAQLKHNLIRFMQQKKLAGGGDALGYRNNKSQLWALVKRTLCDL